ncbi:MAG: thiamine-phosphate kinase [Acidobacteriota bacterium]
MPYSQGVTFSADIAVRRGPGELDLIRRIRARCGGGLRPGGELRLGIGDDCALLRPRRGEELAVTTDMTLAGRHFRLDWHPAEAVGHRTLARGLSDLAAMGARPVAAFLSLGLPGELVLKPGRKAAWIDRFLDGFLALAEASGTPLAGGDLAESSGFAADIVLIGAVRQGRALLRSGARAGDFLYVTGALGGAAAGLERLAEWSQAGGSRRGRDGRIPARLAGVLRPHLYPQPRLAQGQWLARRGLASAGLDISDGLSTDLSHLCEESGVAAEVDAAAVPVFPGASMQQALHGGEDYELLFAARPETRAPLHLAGVAVTRIGRLVRRRAGRPAMILLNGEGAQPLEPRGWQHFA